MAYPILTDVYRCQVLMKSSTGLDEDTCVNNLYFRNDEADGTIEPPMEAVASMLDAFYGGVDPGTSRSISGQMSDEITSVEYVLYDLGQPVPRYPVRRRMATWSGEQASRLPRETAVVLSFYSGQGPRARGRIYLGPLSETAATTTNGFLRVAPSFRDTVAARAEDMRTSSQNATWLTVSPTAASSGVVLGGWVDNAWDTQRSRGLSASVRTTWGQPKA